jgi:uncharacterized short protein YbdD (DUF466 family)
MTCQDCGPSRLERLGQLARRVRQTASLMCGQPDYDTYLAHNARLHPDETPMSRTEFFRNREDKRFGVGNNSGFRCC